MESLLVFVEDSYKSYVPYPFRSIPISEIVENNEKCLDLIYRLLDLGRDDSTVLYKQNFNRASHIIITYLLGLEIERHQNIIKGANQFSSLSDNYLWMYTSLLHDYGYFRKELTISKKLAEIRLKYDLLAESYSEEEIEDLNNYAEKYPCYCTFSYDTIKNYYEYKQDYVSSHNVNENNERNDHGIMGACLAFSQYIKFYINEEYPRMLLLDSKAKEWMKTEPLMYKTACLIAAQHNLFKSSSEESDQKYLQYNLTQLLSTAPILINDENPLLLLLSIVDTIECSKRFSKKANPKKYLETGTILKNVFIDINEHVITVDFSPLNGLIRKRTESEALVDQLDKHMQNIFDLGSWTNYEAEKIGEYTVAIHKKVYYLNKK